MKKIGICIGVLGLIVLIKILLDAKDKKAASANIIGGALGGYGIYLRRQSKEDKESLKIYGGFAYFGVVLFVLGIQEIITEYITHSHNIFYTIILLIIFEIAAHCSNRKEK